VAELPRLGVGITYREAWHWDLKRHPGAIGVVEIIAEGIVDPEQQSRVLELRPNLELLLHGIGLSLGSADGIDHDRIAQVAQLVERIEPPWFSEHIAFTRAGGIEIGHLAPLPFTAEAVATVARNVGALKQAIPGVPLLLENIAYTVALPGAEMSEAEFVRAVIDACDCGLLLDLENVHANATNHGYDAIEHVEMLPLDRVVEVHLAGGVWHESTYVDSHTASIPEESWSLLTWLAGRASIRAVIIERDAELPPFEQVVAESARAQEILDGAVGAAASDHG
jgi:uncharacterized protein (UPF0276 family)